MEFPVAGVVSDTVPIRRQYADADLDKGGGGRFDADTICGQLLGVAEAAYKEARAADLLPKAKSPESRRGAAEQHVEAIYTIHHSDWPAVTAQYGGNGDYEFAITHLHIVKSARMKLTQGSLVAYNDAALQRKLGIAEARVQERFAGDLEPVFRSDTHRRERLEGGERNGEGEAAGNYRVRWCRSAA